MINAIRFFVAVVLIAPAIVLMAAGAILILCAEPFGWLATKAMGDQ